MKRGASRLSAAFAAVLIALGLAACGGSNESAEDPPLLRVTAAEVEETAAQDMESAQLDPISSAASPVYSVDAQTKGAQHVLTFDVADVPQRVRDRLVMATRETAEDPWELQSGRVDGAAFVVRSRHLSDKWLRLLDPGISLPKIHLPALRLPTNTEVEQLLGVRAEPPRCAPTESGALFTLDDAAHILLAPCLDVSKGKPLLKVANNRALSLTYDVPNGAVVTSTQGYGLTERFYKAARDILLDGEQSLLPGAGSAVIRLDTLPVKLEFEPYVGAGVLDLILLVATKGKSAQAEKLGDGVDLLECLNSTLGDREDPVSSGTEFAKALIDVLGSCGDVLPGKLEQDLAFIASTPKVGYRFWDLIRAASDRRASIEISAIPDKLLPEQEAPASAGRGGYCGVVEGFFAISGTASGGPVGVTKGEVDCEAARNTTSDYMSATGPCTSQGAGTCYRDIGGWSCVAPTAGFFPETVSCRNETSRFVMLDATVLGRSKTTDCGTAPGTDIPGPFEVSANFSCQTAQVVAHTLAFAPSILPYSCDDETVGIESIRTRCSFGTSRIGFFTGT